MAAGACTGAPYALVPPLLSFQENALFLLSLLAVQRVGRRESHGALINVQLHRTSSVAVAYKRRPATLFI